MKHIKWILLISTGCLLPNVSNAEINLTFDNYNFTSSNPTLNTHHTPVELKPISHPNFGIKLAAVCALGGGGCSGKTDSNLDCNSQKHYDGIDNACICNDYYKPECPYNAICNNECEDVNGIHYKVTGCTEDYKIYDEEKNICVEPTCDADHYFSTIDNTCICDPSKFLGNAPIPTDSSIEYLKQCTDINGTSYQAVCNKGKTFNYATGACDCVNASFPLQCIYGAYGVEGIDYCNQNGIIYAKNCKSKPCNVTNQCVGFNLTTEDSAYINCKTYNEECYTGCEYRYYCLGKEEFCTQRIGIDSSNKHGIAKEDDVDFGNIFFWKNAYLPDFYSESGDIHPNTIIMGTHSSTFNSKLVINNSDLYTGNYVDFFTTTGECAKMDWSDLLDSTSGAEITGDSTISSDLNMNEPIVIKGGTVVLVGNIWSDEIQVQAASTLYIARSIMPVSETRTKITLAAGAKVIFTNTSNIAEYNAYLEKIGKDTTRICKVTIYKEISKTNQDIDICSGTYQN